MQVLPRSKMRVVRALEHPGGCPLVCCLSPWLLSLARGEAALSSLLLLQRVSGAHLLDPLRARGLFLVTIPVKVNFWLLRLEFNYLEMAQSHPEGSDYVA